MKLLPIACLLAILTATGSAQAQWQWLDKDGRKVFSDRPPPADVAEKNIVKRPASLPRAVTLQDDAAAPGADSSPQAPKDAGEDKLLQARKKQLADAEASKQKAEQDRIAKSRADNCNRARQSKMAYQAGGRMAKTNASGEREIMSDADIASELRHVQGIIDSDCK